MLLRSIRSRLLGLGARHRRSVHRLDRVRPLEPWQDRPEGAIQRAVNEARLIAAQVDDHIGNLTNLLSGLSAAVSTNPADVAANDALLRRVKSELPAYVANILLFSLDGTQYRDLLRGRALLASATATTSGKSWPVSASPIGDVVRARTRGEWVVTIARPVEDQTGRLRGVLAVGTVLKHFQDALRVKDLPPGSVISIVNERGIVIARSVDSADWVGRDLSTRESVARHLAAKDLSEIIVWSDGVERITGSTTAHSAPWLVSVGLPTDIVFATFISGLVWGAVFISGTLLTAFAIAWMLSGRIVRPLRQLSKDASELAAGELSHRSAVHTHDEVGVLAVNFNRMAEALERRQDEARAAADEIRRTKDTLAAVIDASPVAIVCSSAERRIVLWNRGAERMFGYAADEVLGRSFILVPPEGKAESQALFKRAFSGETIRDMELRRLRKDGSRIDVRMTAAPMHNADGTVRNVAWAYEDITDRKRAEEQLRRLAHYDQLTGLPNRLTLQKELGRLLSGDGGKRPTSIVLFDLDGFKDVNDTLGHSTGDELLIEVGQRLINVAELRSEVGLVCRLGGDEFVVIIPRCGDPRVVGDIVQSMLKRLAEPFTINEHVLHIGASAGVAIAPNDGANVDELIANADLALYQAKSDGGRLCRFFLPVLRAQAQARRGLDLELRRAYTENEFELYFQPQIRLTDEAVVGAEALLRWRHPVRGILAPGAFIETLAESPIAPEVGRWIIRTACDQGGVMARHGASARPRRGQSVSQPGATTTRFRRTSRRRWRRAGLPPEALELEITEYAAFNYEDPTGPLLQLQEKGVRLAFDDFGTGYASLNYLTRFPVSRIKIDRSFVGKITENAEDAAIVRSLIAMAHNLELEVIAEGVETAAQAAFLLNERCQEAQGFLYSKPLPAEDFKAYLRTKHLALHVDKLDKRLSRTRKVQRRSGRGLAHRRFPRT